MNTLIFINWSLISNLSYHIISILLFSFLITAVFWIDFGCEYTKIGMAKPDQGIHVALNQQSKWLSPSYFAFWNISNPQAVKEGHCKVECSNLENVSFQEPLILTIICNFAFEVCNKLESILIPYFVFNKIIYGCSNLENVSFQEPLILTIICNFAFEVCNKLESILIPYFVFNKIIYGCSNLENVSFQEPLILTAIKESTFERLEILIKIVVKFNNNWKWFIFWMFKFSNSWITTSFKRNFITFIWMMYVNKLKSIKILFQIFPKFKNMHF